MTKILTTVLAAALMTACSESTPPLPLPLPASIRTIQVTATTSSLVLGDSVEVRATATAFGGSPFPLTTVEWTSSNVAIATVTATGPTTAEVRAISAGSVAITATFESHSGQLALAVSEPPAPPPETSPRLAFIWSRETGMKALPLPPGAVRSYAKDINDLGQVVGSVLIDNASHVLVWTLEGGMTDIGGLTGSLGSSAEAINNAGQVVGSSFDASGRIRAFRWSPSEGMIALPMPPGTERSVAYGINARGDVVGVRNGDRPFRWSQENGTEDLTLFGSDVYGAAMAIADNGDVVGESGGIDNYNQLDVTRMVLWSADGTKRIIDACTGGYFAYDYTYVCRSSANAINSAGQIAGNSDLGGSSTAVLLTMSSWQLVPGINGSRRTAAAAINEAGQVVGSTYSFLYPVQAGRAFLWSPIGVTIDLGALPGRQWSEATGINNREQVVGNSY